MKGIGVPSLLLTFSLFCLLRTMTGVFSAANVADHLLETHLMEWRTVPTGERVSSPEKMHRHYMQTWKRRTAEASAQQRRAKRPAIASESHGRKFSNSRSLVAVNATTEVEALLAFRSAIPTDPTRALTNWTLENEASHCSTWKGVTCDELGQVTEIELRDLGLNGTISPSIGDLAHLSSLNLSGSSLRGAIPSALGRCQNLSVLDLSYNSLGGEVPAELFMLPKLEILLLSMNAFSGRLPEVVEASGCQSLTNLWIDYSEISGTIPSSLSKCQNLKLVSFTCNRLNGSIPAALGDLHQLQELWLDCNGFSGHIPSELASLTKLQWLILEANNLGGEIPPFLGTLSELLVLDLSQNHLTGNLPLGLGNLTKLRVLILATNGLNGTIPEDFGGCVSLNLFDLSSNYFTGDIPKFLGNFSSLVNLDFSNNKLNDDAVALSSLNQCPKLETLMVGHNNIYGSLPVDFTRWPSLKYFSVTGNKLSGGIPASFGIINSSLVLVDFSRNKFTGGFPAQADGSHLSELRVLLFSHNEIEGSIPSWFGNLKSLQVLDLSFNKLTGSIPLNFGNLSGYKGQINYASSSPDAAFTLSQWLNLAFGRDAVSYSYRLQATTFMDLSSNALQGEIPVEIAELVGLKYLIFSQNKFEGIIWAAVQNMKALETLDVSQNNLSGPLPPVLPPSLSTFKVFLNNFSGAIPAGVQYDPYSNSDYLPGNPDLCGNAIQRPCAGENVDSLDSFHYKIRVSDYISFPGLGIGAAGGFYIVAMTALLWAPARVFVLGAAEKRNATAKVQPAYGLFNPRL